MPIDTRDPTTLASLLSSTSTPESTRLSADQLLVQVQTTTGQQRLAALELIIARDADSPAMRVYAMNQLAAAAPDRAVDVLVRALPKMDDGPVLSRACELCTTFADVRLIEPLIRSLARVTTPGPPLEAALRARPEWAALPQITHASAEETVLAEALHGKDPVARIAALDILQCVWPAPQIISHLGVATPGDTFLVDVTWWAARFSSLPRGINEHLWIGVLHQPGNAPLIEKAAARHRSLTGQSDYQITPRFVALLAALTDEQVSSTRATLVKDLHSRLASLTHVRREPAYSGAPDDVNESLEANLPRLSRCDLLCMRLLLDGLGDRATLGEIRHQGEQDLADTSSEHGGLISSDPAKVNSPLRFRDYPSLFAGNDFRYVTSDQLLSDTALGLAQFHFHFQQSHNADRAGPGMGDLNYVRSARCTCVVITSIDEARFDVDYYTPDGAVVDLGVYSAK